jgi:hypothetical protein
MVSTGKYGRLAGLEKSLVFILVAGLVIACVMVSGCSEKPGLSPDVTPPAGGNPASSPQKTPAASLAAPQTTLPVSTPLTFRTAAPASLSCPGGYVPGNNGDSRCYAQCNPGKHCRNPDDFCCGTNCCSKGSVCCGGNCYPGPCQCSGSECLNSYVEKPGVIINGN